MGPLYNGHLWGTQFWPLYRDGRYTEMAVVEGLFCVQTLHLGPVYLAVVSQLAFLQGWPLRGVHGKKSLVILTTVLVISVPSMQDGDSCNRLWLIHRE